MPRCDWCGEKFDKEYADDFFSSETFTFSYSSFRKCLCGSCAVKAIEDEVDGVYFETCEECGKEFDPFDDNSEFRRHFNWYDTMDLWEFWKDKILCGDCAVDVLNDM